MFPGIGVNNISCLLRIVTLLKCVEFDKYGIIST